MKIVILGSKNFDSLEYHISDSLKFLGHKIFHIDINDVVNIPYKYNYWGQKIFRKYGSYIFRVIASKIVEQEPELVICTYRFIHPECIKFIKKNLKNTPVIHINPDALTTFENQEIFVSPYDAYFTKDPFIVDFMKEKMGLNTFYFPEAYNHRIHQFDCEDRNKLEDEVNIDIVCFGTIYPYRAKMVSKLLEADLNVTLFGSPDKRFPLIEIEDRFNNEFITGERKAKVLKGSKIVFNNFHYAEVESVNVKFFEIAGIGGFQICDYKELINEYTGIPADKFTYKSIQEAIEKIKYYLDNKNERHNLADLQQMHFLLNHTYDHRMKLIFDNL